MFIGRVDTLLKWTVKYMDATEDFINRGLMNTDQQVIYAMANEGALPWLQVYIVETRQVRNLVPFGIHIHAWSKDKRRHLLQTQNREFYMYIQCNDIFSKNKLL